jgi:hypothetical protein
MRRIVRVACGVLLASLTHPVHAQTGCETIQDQQSRNACFARAGVPVVDCARPRDAEEAAFCRTVPNNSANRGAGAPPPSPASVSDPLRQWCTEHTDPATCSDLNYCINYCIQHSVGRDPAALTQQLQREHEAKKQQQEAQAATAAKLSNAQQQGYQPITFDDFKLDGKKLAASGAKVMMQGFYQKRGDIELLQPTGVAVAVARSRGDDGNGINLLTDDASRDVRKGLLRCGDPMIAPLGCQMTIIGHASMCTMTTLVGSKDLPCVAVEDGW